MSKWMGKYFLASTVSTLASFGVYHAEMEPDLQLEVVLTLMILCGGMAAVRPVTAMVDVCLPTSRMGSV